MCGRFTLKKEPRSIATLFQLTEPPAELTPRYNIKPGERIAAVAPKADGVTWGLAFIRWGLVPAGSNDGKEFYVNAKAETSPRAMLRTHRMSPS